MNASELDPAAIGQALTTMKRHGVPFDAAWASIVGRDPGGRPSDQPDQSSMRDFMRRHFRAAYLNLPTANGRFNAPSIEGREVRERIPVESTPREQRCKSGDGCERRSGYGRFGSFCKMHADELVLLWMYELAEAA